MYDILSHSSAILDEEKTIVRSSILQCFEEPVSQVINNWFYSHSVAI